MSDAILDSLKAACSSDPMRVNMAEPFAIQYEGRKWACATDGHALAIVPSDDVAEGVNPPNAAALLPGPASTHSASIVDLRAFAGVAGPKWMACPKCNGNPPPLCSKCKGDGVIHDFCSCPKCDGDHECPKCKGKSGGCSNCDDTGKSRPDPRPGVMLGVVLNLDVLAAVLVSAPAEGRVEFVNRGDKAPIHFRTTDWQALVMPLYLTSPNDKPVFTALAPIFREKPSHA